MNRVLPYRVCRSSVYLVLKTLSRFSREDCENPPADLKVYFAETNLANVPRRSSYHFARSLENNHSSSCDRTIRPSKAVVVGIKYIDAMTDTLDGVYV